MYLAAITGVDPTLYEAAMVDGASKARRVFSITIPSIVPVICIMLILNSATILNGGFDQVFYADFGLFYMVPKDTGTLYPATDVIDTYVYRKGIEDLQYSYSTAIGLFKSVVCMILMVVSNTAVKKMGGGDYALW